MVRLSKERSDFQMQTNSLIKWQALQLIKQNLKKLSFLEWFMDLFNLPINIFQNHSNNEWIINEIKADFYFLHLLLGRKIKLDPLAIQLHSRQIKPSFSISYSIFFQNQISFYILLFNWFFTTACLSRISQSNFDPLCTTHFLKI